MNEKTRTRINRLAKRLAKIPAPKSISKRRGMDYVKHSNAIDADTRAERTRDRPWEG